MPFLIVKRREGRIVVVHSAPAQPTHIDALIKRLLVDDTQTRPVTAEGVVRTFLYPCDYELPPERLSALREYALSCGSTRFYVREHSTTGEVVAYKPPEGFTGPIPLPTSEGRAQMEQHWERVPPELWWIGEWAATIEMYAQPSGHRFIEHTLIDERGRWAVLLSEDEYGYLVATPEIARDILALWQTTPAEEIERFVSDLPERGDLTQEQIDEILAHARAGLWL